MRKTKIVATIGPASNSDKVMEEIIGAGVDVARQNLSHGTHEQHKDILERVREVSDDKGEDVAVMLDTKGPEINLQEVDDKISLEEGETVEIVVDVMDSNGKALPVDYAGFVENLEVGDMVLIDDGDLRLEVKEIGDPTVCEILEGGEVDSGSSFNVPEKDLGLHGPTEKDRSDLRFAAKNGFDFVALSFVKDPTDVKKAREILEENGGLDINIISKVEHSKAVENFEGILEVSDGIMVARGDLGVEMPAAEVPMIQKEIIEECNKQGKPVITATQMLKSMTDSSRATRAEVSDIANAVLDGTDAVMLSEETAVGRYPKRSVEVMSEAVEKAEENIQDRIHHTVRAENRSIADIICKNVWHASQDERIDLIVAHTSSGYTARNISKYRPSKRILALTDLEKVKRQLNLVWGVEPFYLEFSEHVDRMICDSAVFLKEKNIVEKDDVLVLSAGVPTSVTGTTNMMRIRSVESLLEEYKGLKN